MPYGCRVRARRGAVVELDVEAEQPDCEPLYTTPRFALGLLVASGGALASALGDDATEQLAAGAIDPAPYIADVRVAIVTKGSLGQDRAPVARYTIAATDARWVAHVAVGAAFDSYAWCDDGDEPALGEAEAYEPAVRRAWQRFASGARVVLHADLGIYPRAPNGRGTLRGGERAARVVEDGPELDVELDHGVRVTAPAIALRAAPADTYERAFADPARWLAELLAIRAPLERARALRWLALQSGGDQVVPQFAPEQLAIPGKSVVLWAIASRIAPRDEAIAGLARLIGDWLGDAMSLAARFRAPLAPVELAMGEVAVIGAYEVACPLELALGALTLLLAFDAPRALGHAIDGLDALATTTWLGYPPPIWAPRTAYLRAARARVPPALPRALVEANAGRVGPSDTDRYG